MFKVKNKDARTTSLTYLLASYFTACSIVSIVNFEQVSTGSYIFVLI